MMITFGLIALIIVLADFYFFSAVKSLFTNWKHYSLVKWSYVFSSVVILGVFTGGWFMYINGIHVSGKLRVTLQGIVFCLFIPKIFALGFFLLDDLIRLGRYTFSFFQSIPENPTKEGISRLRFLQLSGLGVFGLFFTAFTYGILKGAYNFSVKKIPLKIKHLPKAFEGVKIIQISDLHVGSFYSSKPLEEAVKIINEQEADFIFFTGDLVNEIAEEALRYIPVLKQLKAKQGIYSILGNHDYGDYYYNKSAPDFLEKKAHNKALMKQIHKDCGFNLLLDEAVSFELEGEVLSIVGVENWGAKGRFPKYGNLSNAVKNTENSKVKLLLSHDPSHWDAQVRQEFKNIDVTFSGHTHGMQFGIEIPGIKWSPVKYMYKQWAGLYEEGNQKLYVNRGLGFIGYPGRVGISPEISVFELKTA